MCLFMSAMLFIYRISRSFSCFFCDVARTLLSRATHISYRMKIVRVFDDHLHSSPLFVKIILQFYYQCVTIFIDIVLKSPLLKFLDYFYYLPSHKQNPSAQRHVGTSTNGHMHNRSSSSVSCILSTTVSYILHCLLLHDRTQAARRIQPWQATDIRVFIDIRVYVTFLIDVMMHSLSLFPATKFTRPNHFAIGANNKSFESFTGYMS